MTDEDLFKPPPVQERKLQPHEVCIGCGRVLEVWEQATRGMPGLCDVCARGQRPPTDLADSLR